MLIERIDDHETMCVAELFLPEALQAVPSCVIGAWVPGVVGRWLSSRAASQKSQPRVRPLRCKFLARRLVTPYIDAEMPGPNFAYEIIAPVNCRKEQS